MKTLFLIDGAYQAAKTALVDILQEHRTVSKNWQLINKFSTKIAEEKTENDLIGIDVKSAENYLAIYDNSRNGQQDRVKERYFCYKYPQIKGQKDLIYCIDTKDIEELIENSNVTYGFLVVRHPQCISDLVYRYERNGRLNVVPVFLYTDYTYIKAYRNKKIKEKWDKLLSSYIESYRRNATDNRVLYESVLVYNGEKNRRKPSERAKANLREQLLALIDRVQNKNGDLVVVTEKERTYIPLEIQERKGDIEKIICDPEQYRKNVFVMMKYHDTPAERDDLYLKIKNAVESKGYNCIRADDEYIQTHFPRNETKNKPSLVYWLATFLCGQGIAIFEKDDKGIALNPNVAYEMGLMKQQGKHVEIFVPNIPNIKKRNDLFFDVNNCWQNRYKDTKELIEKVKQSLR